MVSVPLATPADIGAIIARWTNENPKKPSPNEPILLVKPEYFEQVRSAGVAIVKALYGRGKTYGFGLNMYHIARSRNDQVVLYINAREVKDRTNSSTKIDERRKVAELNKLLLRRDPLDIVRLICVGYYLPEVVNTDDGIYLAVDTAPLKAVCPNLENYLREEPTTSLRNFIRDIAKSSPKRLVVVIDEFEQITMSAGGRPDPEYIYRLIETILQSLRPGILDESPQKFGIVLLIQELYYPSDRMKELISQGAYPSLGRMFSVNDDGSIPVTYTIDSYLEYIENAIINLLNKHYIDPKIARNAVQIFKDGNIKRLLREYLPNMPALVSFSILQQLLVTALSSDSITSDTVRNEFASIIRNYPAYAIYGGKREVAKGENLANALAGLLKDYYRSNNIIPTKIKRIGFEGAYVVMENGAKMIVARLSDVDDEESYLREFSKLYGGVLKAKCAQRLRTKNQQPPCEIIFLYSDDAEVSFADMAIRSLLRRGVDGVPVSFTYKPRKISYDDLFVLIVRYNQNIATLAGDKRYVNSPERIQSLMNKIFIGEAQ